MSIDLVQGMRRYRLSATAILLLSACVSSGRYAGSYARSARLDDRTIATDLARFDSTSRVFTLASAATPRGALARARAVAMVGLARDAYERNDDGALVALLAKDADSLAAMAVGPEGRPSRRLSVSRSLRPDLWTLRDSLEAFPEVREDVVALEVALLRAQYEVLGAPRCKEWEAEAQRIAGRVRRALIVPVVTPSILPSPMSAAAPRDVPVAQPSPAEAPATLANVPNRVHFALDQHTLAPRTRQVLDALVERLAAFPTVSITLEGHTDPRASVAYNMALSQRRAESVRDYLISRGISSQRFTISVRGKSRLESEERSVTQLARNRRVMLRYYAPDGREIPTISQLDDLQLERRRP